jgi:hypothetical protein
MTEVSSPSESIKREIEEEAQRGAVGETLGQDDHEAGVENNIGLTELRAMDQAYRALESLDKDGQSRAFMWLAEALDIRTFKQSAPAVELGAANTSQSQTTLPSDETLINPREFISRKKPESLVERVACLAYYLARHRGMNHFKTADIVALNTEAAAHRFGNPSRDVDNADRHNGYLVSAGNGKKQLTVRGEAVVEALPDRESVKAALKDHPHKQRRSSVSSKKASTPTPES